MLYNPHTYFRTPHGRMIRETFFAQQKNQKCYICKKRTNLVPHHLTYEHIGEELVYDDLIALCSKDQFRRRSCHYRVHFSYTGKKIPIEKKIMMKRIRILRLTNSIRNLRPSAVLRVLSGYSI